MKKHLSLILAVIILVASFAGCAPKTENVNNDTANTEVEEITGISLFDQAGREVTLEKPAEKIVSVYYISSAILTALGCEDNIVGIEMKADTRELYKLAAPQYIELPAVGSGKGINVEAIAALSPDLVIIPKKLTDSAVSLEELGIPVAVVNPETKTQLAECVNMLGKLCGKEERAARLVSYYEAKAKEMAELTASLEKPSVYLCSASSYFSACTSGMYQTELIETAGGVSVTKDIEDSYWQIISPEQLVAENPEYIFSVVDAEYTLDDIYADEALADVAAIKNRNVYTIPSDIEAWDYPTASSVLGVMWMTSVLHPEAYPEATYISEAKEFYKTFFNIEVTEENLGF